jgi:hypothetical protein
MTEGDIVLALLPQTATKDELATKEREGHKEYKLLFFTSCSPPPALKTAWTFRPFQVGLDTRTKAHGA